MTHREAKLAPALHDVASRFHLAPEQRAGRKGLEVLQVVLRYSDRHLGREIEPEVFSAFADAPDCSSDNLKSARLQVQAGGGNRLESVKLPDAEALFSRLPFQRSVAGVIPLVRRHHQGHREASGQELRLDVNSAAKKYMGQETAVAVIALGIQSQFHPDTVRREGLEESPGDFGEGL